MDLGIKLFLIGLVTLSVLTLCYGTEADKWPHPMYSANRYTKKSTKSNPSAPFIPGYGGDLLSLSREDLHHIKKVLTKMPIKDTPWEVIKELALRAEEDEFFDMSQLGVDPTEDLMELLVDDQQLRDRFNGYSSPYIVSDSHVLPRDEEVPEPEDRPQTQGVEGCYADYDSYIGPMTEDFRYEIQLRSCDANPLFCGLIEQPRPQPAHALILLDSNAKRPTGLFEGRFHWVGASEQCDNVIATYNVTFVDSGVTEERTFKGRYARLDMPISLASINSSLPFLMGVCVPDTCSDENITSYVTENNTILSMFFNDPLNLLSIESIYFEQDIDFSTDIPAKAAFGILIGGLILILISSCYDGWGRHRVIRNRIKKYATGSTDNKEQPLTAEELKLAKTFLYAHPGLKDKLEVAFASYSLYSNLKNIFSSKPLHGEYQVAPLDGIRVLSFLWLIKGLSYVYGIAYTECWSTDNLIPALLKFTREWSFMSVLGVYHANTSLFFISGFVCVQMWYKAFDRNNKKVTFGLCLKYIVLRWLSIMPPIMGMLMIYTCLHRYLGDGPMNPIDISDAHNCRSTWWITMLFFHNVIRTDEQCFAWSFMFGAVWQLNLVSIIILIPLVLKPVAGYVLMAFMYLAHIIITVIWNQRVYDGELSWFFDILQTPWCNAGPYVIGMMFAAIIRNTKGDWKTGWQKFGIFCFWVLSVGGFLIVIYLPWDKYKGDGKDWPKAGQVAFDVLSPQIIGLSLGWITWACYKGYGGVVGSLLNWKAFTALSKLCLPAAVFMAPTMTRYFYGRLQSFYIHENHMGHLYYGHIIGIFIFGVMTAAFYQWPIAKGMKIQIEAKSRLEIFLHCRHPEILDKFSGDLEKDCDVWDELEEMYERPKERVTSSSSADILRGRKPIGGYIPHQEDEEVLSVHVDYTKPPIVNGMQGSKPCEDLQMRQPPKYEEINKTPSQPAPVEPAETTEL